MASEIRAPLGDAADAAGGRTATRASLLDAASALMREGDTMEISLSEIAQKADVNSALVKYYFGSKRGLFLALLERDAHAAIERLGHLLEMDVSPTQKLRLHLTGLVNAYALYPYNTRLICTLIRDSSEEEAKQISDRYVRPIADAQARLLAEGVQAGEFKPCDPTMFYFSVVGACEEIFVSRQILKYCFGVSTFSASQRKLFTEQVTAMLLGGIAA
jgi:AcrR family transcriptional regulator